jgi:hypothetical protein
MLSPADPNCGGTRHAGHDGDMRGTRDDGVVIMRCVIMRCARLGRPHTREKKRDRSLSPMTSMGPSSPNPDIPLTLTITTSTEVRM